MGKLRGTWQNAEDNHNRHQVQTKFNHCFAPWKEIALGIILLHHLFVKKKKKGIIEPYDESFNKKKKTHPHTKTF